MRAGLFLLAATVWAAPTVTKVEPPNWWLGHSMNPVRVLLRGTELTGARVTAPGLRVSRVATNPAGTYLFADVAIPPGTAPGHYRLMVETPQGRVEAPFDVDLPLPRPGRYAGFSPDDVMYLIMPDRFANGDRTNDDPPVSRGLFSRQNPRFYHGGDLQGIIDHLPYLKDLGVTALWLNPVYENTNRTYVSTGRTLTDYHGYGATDLYGVEEHFGTLAKLRELVDKAHIAGIKVIQDQVANHVGPAHPWVRDSPTPTWFHGTLAQHLINPFAVPLIADPHALTAVRAPTLDGWFVDLLPDLNQDDPETARYLIQNALWWVGSTGFDGIRQDTLPYVPRTFWREWMTALQREYPQLRVVGEVLVSDPSLTSFFQGGRAQYDGVDSRVDTVFDFPLHFAIRDAFARRQPIRKVVDVLGHDYLYPNPRVLVTLLSLHDLKRFLSEPGATVAGLKLAYTFLLTTRGTPLIYYGDEAAMRGGDDPDNRRDFPGGWPGDAHTAFTAAGRTPEEQQVFAHVQQLTRLRAAHEALRRGSVVHLAVGEQTYAYARVSPLELLTVAINNGDKAATIEWDAAAAKLADGQAVRDLLGGQPAVVARGGRVRVTLPARSAAVYGR